MFSILHLRRQAGILLVMGLAGAVHAQSTNSPGQLGAIPSSNGVTFRVWAPNASSAAVRGDFNGWGTTGMASEGANGYWSVDVPSAQVGQEYLYHLNGNLWRRDPRSRRVTHSTGNSVIYDTTAFDWGNQVFVAPAMNDTVIYQMHVGTYNAEEWVPSSFDKVVERLDHVRNLGISAIKVMPVNEFATDKSWGYNPSDLFAIESALGGPNAFKRFVRAAHERGIAVFVDVVHNHYGPTDLSLWEYDGWSQNGLGGIYFYNSLDGKAYTWWGDTRPNYGSEEVRRFIRDQVLMFVDEYHVDGFRWDSVFNIIRYNDGANYNEDGRSLIDSINTELANTYPNVIRIAEDHYQDGLLNFQSQWDVSFHDHLRWQVTQGSDANRNMDWLRDELLENPNFERVVFSESHDEVGDLNDKVRLPRAIDSGDPSGIWARKRQLLAASIVMTKPGIPMIFQGQEMNEDWTFSSDTALRWALTNTHVGVVRAYTDLIHNRRNLRGGLQGLKGTGIDVHMVDDVKKVIGYIRWDQGGQQDDVVVVANFSSDTFEDASAYPVAFPSEGTWYSHFNGDSVEYGPDFDGIGPTQVEATGNPPIADVEMGMYSMQVFSKQEQDGVGNVSFNPPEPDGCVELTITFDPDDGPLAETTNVVMYHGWNGWQDIDELALVDQGDGTWAVTVQIPPQTFSLQMAFNNGEEGEAAIWDSNFGMDWSLDITGCADLPALVTASPSVPQGCVPVTITYQVRGGPLTNANEILLHHGWNDWQGVQTLPMSNTVDDVWSLSVPIPEATFQLDFAFTDGESEWDNNDDNNWHVYVTGCYASQVTGLTITNPPGDLMVAFTQTVKTLSGGSHNMAGDFVWTNLKTGASGTLAASTNWAVADIALEQGVNLFRISGLRDTTNPNAGAWDSATNEVYASGWSEGQNGGAQWGGGWQLESSGSAAGHFHAEGGGTLDSATHAWGLWANSGGLSEAVRPFAVPLHVGDQFRLGFENGNIDTDSSVGVALANRFGQSLFEFLFVGGGTNYLINDELEARDTGIPWSNTGIELSFELTSGTTYVFSMGTNEYTGALAVTSEALIKQVRIWNANAGHTETNNLYVVDLSIDGDLLEPIPHHAEVAITRQEGSTVVPPPDMDEVTFGEAELLINDSVSGQLYDIYASTNLLSDWFWLGLDVPGNDGPIALIFTNTADELFYTIGTRPAP